MLPGFQPSRLDVSPQLLRILRRDRLPSMTPWWGVVLARVLTLLAQGLAVAIAFGRCPGS